MRVLKRTIPQLLIVPAFLALQIASQPLMMCVVESCQKARCELTKVEQPKPRRVAVTDFEPGSCCAKAERKAAPAQSSSPCGGCEGREATPSKVDFGCAMDGGPKSKSWPAGCDEKSDKCPLASTACSPCLPIPVYAEPSLKIATRLTYDHTFILMGAASQALVEADQFRVFSHTHSPPSYLPARAGPQICIENCSLLI